MKTPTDLEADSAQKLVEAINPIIADAYAVHLKSKNFHWHLSGSHSRDHQITSSAACSCILETENPLRISGGPRNFVMLRSDALEGSRGVSYGFRLKGLHVNLKSDQREEEKYGFRVMDWQAALFRLTRN